MAGALSTIDLIGLVVPFVVFFVLLVVYYVWEGRREQRLREQYEEEMTDG
ncbi:MAG: hypothetical protein ACOCUA_01505 [archaeon]